MGSKKSEADINKINAKLSFKVEPPSFYQITASSSCFIDFNKTPNTF
jgi:hypothetical protein